MHLKVPSLVFIETKEGFFHCVIIQGGFVNLAAALSRFSSPLVNYILKIMMPFKYASSGKKPHSELGINMHLPLKVLFIR